MDDRGTSIDVDAPIPVRRQHPASAPRGLASRQQCRAPETRSIRSGRRRPPALLRSAGARGSSGHSQQPPTPAPHARLVLRRPCEPAGTRSAEPGPRSLPGSPSARREPDGVLLILRLITSPVRTERARRTDIVWELQGSSPANRCRKEPSIRDQNTQVPGSQHRAATALPREGGLGRRHNNRPKGQMNLVGPIRHSRGRPKWGREPRGSV